MIKCLFFLIILVSISWLKTTTSVSMSPFECYGYMIYVCPSCSYLNFPHPTASVDCYLWRPLAGNGYACSDVNVSQSAEDILVARMHWHAMPFGRTSELAGRQIVSTMSAAHSPIEVPPTFWWMQLARCDRWLSERSVGEQRCCR